MDAITANGITFTPDFRIASYAGEVFEFSRQQSAIVRVIVEAHQQGLPAIHGDSILSAIFTEGHEPPRVDHAFKSGGTWHSAWGKVVVRSGRNVYRIGNFQKPQKSPNSAPVSKVGCP